MTSVKNKQQNKQQENRQNKISMRKLYKTLHKKRHEIKKQEPIYITQNDFTEGTYIIDKTGYYILSEDIIFSPNPDNDYLPKPDNPKYQTLGYSLGFFTAISIFGKDVYLDMNGHSLKASPEFTLQQRFFSLIELADAPFIKNEGPGSFSNGINAAENVIVSNGEFGLSSHHSIHGNMASNVLLENLKCRDFEFIGIALNGGDNIFFKNIDIESVRQDIPVLATYSAARFAKMFAKMVLARYTLSNEQKDSLNNVLSIVQAEMDTTFTEVMNGQKVSSDLFRNDTGLPDGNVYGCIVKNQGVAVNDFVNAKQLKDDKRVKTNNVFLHSVKVKDMKCRVDEVVALLAPGAIGIQTDVAGAVFQIDKLTNKDGAYKGTSLSNLQIKLAEIAISLGIKLGKNNITQDLINWTKNGTNISTLLNKGYKYVCGGDSMAHFDKSAFGYRFDALNNVVLYKCRLEGIENTAVLGNDVLAGHYKKSHPLAKREGYCGSDATGINISCCSDVKIKKCKLDKIISKNGLSIGINVIFNSDVCIEKTLIKDIKAGTLNCKNGKNGKDGKKKWRGKDYYNQIVKYKNLPMPNKVPVAIGIRIEKDSLVNLDKVEIHDLHSCGKPIKISRQ